MLITLKIIGFILIAISAFFLIAIFISQFYDEKRIFLLAKQNWTKKDVNNIIKLSLFSLSFGLAFYNINLATIIVLIALLISLITIKKTKFKFTRRSLSLFLTTLLCVGLLIFLLNIISLYSLLCLTLLAPELLIVVINFLLMPYEMLIRNYYIHKAKRRIKENPKLKIVGITGSFGKTSFKNYLYTLLCGKYNVIKTPGSINTPMGLCKFINETLTYYDDIMLLEMGVDAPNTMKKFFKIFHPHIGVITYIGDMHLATFKTIENIQKEKLSLFDNLIGEKAKFYNGDCPLLKVINQENAFSYSINEINVISSTIMNTIFSYRDREYSVPIFGKHQLVNLLGAIKVASYLGVKEDVLLSRLPLIKAEKHRLSIEKVQDTYVIDDAYNTNFLGLSETIKALREFKGKKGIILNGIIEAGEKSDELNYQIGTLLHSFDEVVLLSTAPKSLKRGLKDSNKRFKIFEDYSEAFKYLMKWNLHYILLTSRPEKEHLQ